MSAIMLKCYPSTTTTAKSQPLHQLKPPVRGRPKCLCPKVNISPSSSCSSLSSDYSLSSKQRQTQHRAHCLQKTTIKKVNISYDELSRSQSRQARRANQPMKSRKAVQGFEKFYASFNQQSNTDYSLGNKLDNLNFVAFNGAQFYSCSSGESETDEKSENTDKNHRILQLLHKVESLINKDSTIDKNLQTQVEQFNAAESSSRDATQESQTKLSINDKVSKFTSTTQLDALIWPSPPCFCNCRAHMTPSHFSFFPPFNLTTPALDGVQLPEPFVFEEVNSLKDAPTGNKGILTVEQLANNSSVNVHRSLEYTVETPCASLAAVNNIKMDVCIQTSESLCLKEDIATECDDLNNQSLCTETDSFKDCSSGENSMLAVNQLPVHFTCTCVCKQILLKGGHQSLLLSSIPITESKIKELSNFAESVDVSLKNNSLDRQVDGDCCPSPLEIEEYVDEELQPRYVDKIFTEPFEVYKSNADSLPAYDDEEPVFEKFSNEVDFAGVRELAPSETYQPCIDCQVEYDEEEPTCLDTTVEEVNPEIEIADLEKLPLPTELDQTVEFEIFPDPIVPAAEFEVEENVASTPFKAFQKLPNPMENVRIEQLNESTELIEDENATKAEPVVLSYNEDDDINEAEKPVDKSAENDLPPPAKEQEISSFDVNTSPKTAGNIYNFLPETDKRDSKQLMSYESSGEEEQELAKEKLAEERKRPKPDDNRRIPDTLKQAEPKERSAQMKYFIDSLILDLEAMDYARRKSQFERNICKPRNLAHCIRDSFPVTITDVTDLGANSLYVKWKIHDCFAIAGYEIYTDGYLTNRFYDSRHHAAVVTQVDVTLPHRIALVAQPAASARSIDSNCNMSNKCHKLKTLPWCTTNDGQRQSRGTLWTPSIFLYDPLLKRDPPTPGFERQDIRRIVGK